MTRERDTKEIREIKLMRIITALSILVEDEQGKKSNDFFFKGMKVGDQ